MLPVIRVKGDRRYIAVAVIMTLLLLDFLFTARYVNSTQQAQQRQGRLVEHSICTTLGKLAALKPPAGNPATNPSRAYEDSLHATLDQLGPDLGCRR